MGTGAFMSVRNNLTTAITSSVSDLVCMYENGEDGSHLECFNDLTLQPNTSLDRIYIEANGSFFGGCSTTQSQFTINFSTGGGLIGSVTLNLGSGAFNTSVAANSAPQSIQVSIESDGNQFTIGIQVNPVAVATRLVNSWIRANASAIQDALQLPPQSWGPFTFEASTLQGLNNLTCINATIVGPPGGTIKLSLTLTAEQLVSLGIITIVDVPVVASGLTLEWPQLTAKTSLDLSASDITVRVTGLNLVGGTVDLNGGIPLPNWLLTELLRAVEAIVNNDPVQQLIVGLINQYLPNKGS